MDASGITWVDAPAGRIRFRQVGEGEPAVLFIHALGGTHRQWAAHQERLRRIRRSVALDLRGHGESDGGPDDDYALATLAEDVDPVVEALGLETVILVGHSFGAGVAAAYAGSHPDRVAGLMFVDPIGEQRRAPEDLRELVDALRSDYDGTITEYWESILVGAGAEVREAVLADL